MHENTQNSCPQKRTKRIYNSDVNAKEANFFVKLSEMSVTFMQMVC